MRNSGNTTLNVQAEYVRCTGRYYVGCTGRYYIGCTGMCWFTRQQVGMLTGANNPASKETRRQKEECVLVATEAFLVAMETFLVDM